MDKYLGKRLDGRYEIHELIGVGGMANVYRCTDTVDDREVAVKILKDEYLNNEEFIRRFKNESKAIAMLSHPNIVKVYDVSFGDMIQYIVMEYIDGITLKEYIDQQGIIEWKDAIHLTAQILKALQHAPPAPPPPLLPAALPLPVQPAPTSPAPMRALPRAFPPPSRSP